MWIAGPIGGLETGTSPLSVGNCSLVRTPARRMRLTVGEIKNSRPADPAGRGVNIMTLSVETSGLGFGLALALAAPASAADLKMMTGPQGRSWIPPGGRMKEE